MTKYTYEKYMEDVEERSKDDAQYILENIMYRRNWTVDTRDELAEYLRGIVQKTGGKYNKAKRKMQNN